MRLRFALLLPVFLAACSGLQLLPAYNPDIEKGLNSYHVKVLEFLSTMQANGTSVSGKYKGMPVKEFYAASSATLENLVTQAEAAEPSAVCGSSRLASLGIRALSSQTADLASSLDAGIGTNLAAGNDTSEIDLSSGSCTVVTLKVLLANHQSMQKFHAVEGKLLPVSAGIIRDLIGDSVRIALTAENSKK